MIDLIRDFPFSDAGLDWALQDTAEFHVDGVICASMRARWVGWTHTETWPSRLNSDVQWTNEQWRCIQFRQTMNTMTHACQCVALDSWRWVPAATARFTTSASDCTLIRLIHNQRCSYHPPRNCRSNVCSVQQNISQLQ